MPEINLTPETRGGDERKKKKRMDFEYTDPSKEKSRKDERKAPGSFGMWMKSLFRRTPPGEKGDNAMPQELTLPEQHAEKKDSDVEDIFANVDVPGRERAAAQASKKQKAPEKAPVKLKKLPEEKKKKEDEEKKAEGIRGVNLLPEEFSTKVDFRGRGILLGLTVGATVVLVGLLYGGLLLYESGIANRTREATDTRRAIEAEIEALGTEQDASIAFEAKLTLAEALLDQHVYWTKFFRLLEEYTVEDVYFNGSLLLSAPGHFTLAATGRDYASVARQLLSFRRAIENGELLSNVEITDASQSQDTNGVTATTFTVELDLLPNVDTYTADEYAASGGRESLVPQTVIPQSGSGATPQPSLLPPVL